MRCPGRWSRREREYIDGSATAPRARETMQAPAPPEPIVQCCASVDGAPGVPIATMIRSPLLCAGR